jgi:hypothetical protein
MTPRVLTVNGIDSLKAQSRTENPWETNSNDHILQNDGKLIKPQHKTLKA